MKGVLKMSRLQTSQDTINVIFSQVSVAGLERLTWPAGGQISLFGPDHAPVNHFRWPGLERALKMKGIYGRSSRVSYASVRLQWCLESRLRQRLDVNGSPEYGLTWKRWDMPSGAPICALRALGRRISGSGYGGWPTPLVNDAMGSKYALSNGKRVLKLPGVAELAGWRSPTATECQGGVIDVLRSPRARYRLRDQVWIAGWGTPTCRDHKDGSTDMANTKAKGLLGRQALGACSILSPVQMAKSGALNPEHCRWLMGYPKEWSLFKDMAMR